MVKVNLSSKENIKRLSEVKDHRKRVKLVQAVPETVLYANKYWNDNKEKFSELVTIALKKNPEIITMFKGKDGLVADRSHLRTAVLTDPTIIKKLPKELKHLMSDGLFIEAFIRNPIVLTFDTEPTKKRSGYGSKTWRTCLKAIRLFEGTSTFRKDYDEEALRIAKRLKESKGYQQNKFAPELLQTAATLMNVMIKKRDQRLRACSADAWKVNKNKSLYKAVRTSVRKDSELEDLISDIPTKLLEPKVVKRMVIVAITVNPEIYFKLKEYGLGEYREDNTVKYNVLKSLKKHRLLYKAQEYLSEDDIQKGILKLNRLETKAKNKALANSNLDENVV